METLEEAGQPFYYSTRGREQDVALHNGIRLQGAMNLEDMTAFCREHEVKLLVDAAHPFATLLHQTVALAAQVLTLPVIRLERIYPPRDETHIVWCDDFEEAISRIRSAGVHSLLALTGVQSIAKLSALWREEDIECHFRILRRESSIRIARQSGFPEGRLHFYRADEADDLLMSELRPEAVLLKESGTSGGFEGKARAALALGIRVFALRRPPLPREFITVNGPHGLRRKVEKLLPEFYALHSGLTTGTCATVAAMAAVSATFSAYHDPVFINLPNGESIDVGVESVERVAGKDNAFKASVVKDAGDDPDVTNGMSIQATVELVDDHTERSDYDISLLGGEGIGTVTLPGLGLEVGGPAINATPRRMITDNVSAWLRRQNISPAVGRLTITLSIPGGEEAARRTFNPRIGVVGGLSVIGTSGIVKPFSSEAFVDSIRKSMQVAAATGSERVVINSGARSERFLRAVYPALPLQAFVHYGNFIGETLKIAHEAGFRSVTMGLMIGKAVKLAEGHLDTHSRHSSMNPAFIARLAREAGCKEAHVEQIARISLAREVWTILSEDEARNFCRVLTGYCRRHCEPLLPGGRLQILIVADDGRIVGNE